MTLLIFFAAFALFFSFVSSVAEAVLLSVTSPYIESLEQNGKRSGGLLRSLKDDVNKPLLAIRVMNIIACTVGAAGVGSQSAAVFGRSYPGPEAVIFIAVAALTVMILVFSEIIPKTLGAIYWRQLAPILASVIRTFIVVFYPFVLFSKFLTKDVSNTSELKEFSREEFAAMAELGMREGQLEAKESRILKNLFRFRSTKIANVMTPRTVVFALQEEMTIAEFFEKHHQTPFSRIPIYIKDRDDITGFVLKDDIFLAQARDLNDSRLHEFKRDIKAVSSENSLSEVFEFMLDGKEHIALVVDEYGMDGIVTLEDVVETLLGLEIVDEADKTEDMQALARAMWEKRARRIGLLDDEMRQTRGSGETKAAGEPAANQDEKEPAIVPGDGKE